MILLVIRTGQTDHPSITEVMNVMKTDKAHEIPVVSPADYTPAGEPLDAKTTRLLRADCEKKRMKEVRDLKKSCVLLYANLMS